MFQYHCLNPIAEKGLKLFGDNYKKTETADQCDVCLLYTSMRRIILLTMDMDRGKMVTVFYSCWIWETVTGPLQHTDMR